MPFTVVTWLYERGATVSGQIHSRAGVAGEAKGIHDRQPVSGVAQEAVQEDDVLATCSQEVASRKGR